MSSFLCISQILVNGFLESVETDTNKEENLVLKSAQIFTDTQIGTAPKRVELQYRTFMYTNNHQM